MIISAFSKKSSHIFVLVKKVAEKKNARAKNCCTQKMSCVDCRMQRGSRKDLGNSQIRLMIRLQLHADFLNLTLFYIKLYTVDAPEILIHYEPSKILSTNENRTAPGKRALFLHECQKTQCSLKMEYTLEI